MARFNFCITTGEPGFAPDDLEYVAAKNAIDAYDAICKAIRDFREYSDEPDGVVVFDWRAKFDRVCWDHDATRWDFALAHDPDRAIHRPTLLSLVGMSQVDFDREKALEG